MRSAPLAARGFSPLDEELALGRGAFSPYVVEAIVRLGAAMSFEQVPAQLAFFTQVGIGEETARHLTEQAGAKLVEIETAEVGALEQHEGPVAGPTVQQVSVDGAMVPLVKAEWAEVKTLVIGNVERGGEGDPHTGELSYFSRLAEAEVFCRLAETEVHRRGTETAGTVCAVMDGAEWLQHFIDWHCPDAVRILDFPHAAQHVSEAGHTVFAPGTPEASEWLAVQLRELKHGDPDRVLAALRALPIQSTQNPAEAREKRDQVLAYLDKRREQITYAQFAAAGYPIGSGIAESANKLLVEARLKGSGMHWARTSVDPMLALRAAAFSGRWQLRWRQVWPQLRRRERSRRCEAEGPAPPTNKPTPAPRPERLPALKLPPKGLIVNGRPTANHPWKKHALSLHGDQSCTSAKL